MEGRERLENRKLLEGRELLEGRARLDGHESAHKLEAGGEQGATVGRDSLYLYDRPVGLR